MTVYLTNLSCLSFNDQRANPLLDFHEKWLCRMQTAKGSCQNHQSWVGGYIDHVNQCLSLANRLWSVLPKQPEFTIESAYMVLYFHDVEKIWKYSPGPQFDKNEFLTKTLYNDYRIVLTDEELDAIKYIHGEGDEYCKTERKMSPLACFCHVVDIMSARMFYNLDRNFNLSVSLSV